MNLRRAIVCLSSLAVALGCSRTQLPIVSVPATEPGRLYVALIISGDGGWAHIDKELAAYLGHDGIPTLGLDSLRYFWFARSQAEIGEALTKMLELAEHEWPGRKFILIGFSRGANVLPFMLEGLSTPLRNRIARVALLSPAAGTEFEFRIRDWWSNTHSPDAHPLAPAIESLHDLEVVCLYGTQDPSALCPHLPPGAARVVSFPGGHHVDNEYARVESEILAGLPGFPATEEPARGSSRTGP